MRKLLGYAYVAGQADDDELRHVGTRRQRGIAKQKIETVVCKYLHGDIVANEYSLIAN